MVPLYVLGISISPCRCSYHPLCSYCQRVLLIADFTFHLLLVEFIHFYLYQLQCKEPMEFFAWIGFHTQFLFAMYYLKCRRGKWSWFYACHPQAKHGKGIFLAPKKLWSPNICPGGLLSSMNGTDGLFSSVHVQPLFQFRHDIACNAV